MVFSERKSKQIWSRIIIIGSSNCAILSDLFSFSDQLPGIKLCHHGLQHLVGDGGKNLDRRMRQYGRNPIDASWEIESSPCHHNPCQGWCKSREGTQASACSRCLIYAQNGRGAIGWGWYLKRILNVMLTFWRSLEPVMAGTFLGLEKDQD